MLPAPALWLDRTKPHRCSAAQLVSFRISFKRNFEQCSPSPMAIVPVRQVRCSRHHASRDAAFTVPLKTVSYKCFGRKFLHRQKAFELRLWGFTLFPDGEGVDEQAWKGHHLVGGVELK